MLYVRPSRIRKTEWQTIYKRFSFRTIHKMIDCNMPCTVHCSELKGITDVSSVAMIAVAATTTTNCHIERYIRTRIAEFTFALRSAGEWNESLNCVSLHSRFSPFFPLHFTRAHYYRSLHTGTRNRYTQFNSNKLCPFDECTKWENFALNYQILLSGTDADDHRNCSSKSWILHNTRTLLEIYLIGRKMQLKWHCNLQYIHSRHERMIRPPPAIPQIPCSDMCYLFFFRFTVFCANIWQIHSQCIRTFSNSMPRIYKLLC